MMPRTETFNMNEIYKTCTLRFEKVREEDNQKVMLGCKKIASSETGVEVYQSENRNVITAFYRDYLYHVTLEEIVNAMLREDSDERKR
jgi:hypothetical protein